ncbi:MAG TPA: fibronectin type III domain-containing protein, partial [Alphaproteobacteria bacterium]|nr:fibronectin type III domain-containing protein [Alphaproteobacteria bacterium]
AAAPTPIDNLIVAVCFGWPQLVGGPSNTMASNTPLDPTPIAAPYLRTVARDNNSITYETVLPAGLWSQYPKKTVPTELSWFWDWGNRLNGRPRHLYDGWDLVPAVNMHVVAMLNGSDLADATVLDAVQRVGLSFRGSSFIATLVVIVAAWRLLLLWAEGRNIRGGYFLPIISNRNRYASLSQFQIMLWTLVIGAGAVYVMALTGSLIMIPGQALALLGISGFSALSAAVKSRNDATKAQTSPDAASQVVTNPAAPREPRMLSQSTAGCVIFWQEGDGGTATSSYIVTLTDDQNAAVALAGAPGGGVVDPLLQIPNPPAGRAYTFTVCAVDMRGNRSAPISMRIDNSVAAPGAAPPAAAAHLGLTATLQNGNGALLTWNAVGAEAYVVQYSVAGSNRWSTLDDPARVTRVQIPELKYDTNYEFRVFSIGGSRILGPSSSASLTTAKRTPKWSDLVVWDGIHELDITRVQMLLFTVVAAVFVVLKIGDEGIIPTIPDSIVLLMGLSNGVYVGGKFIGATK